MKKKIVVEGNRAKGSGTLVLRGNIWHARWMVNGQIYTRSTKCTDKDDAEKKLAEFVKPFQEETTLEIIENLAAKVRVQEKRIAEAKKEVKTKEQEKIRIDCLLDVYMSDVSTGNIALNTQRGYTAKIRKFQKFVNKKYVYEVTQEDATKFLEFLKTEVAEILFNCALVFLRTSFGMAMKKDHRIKTNVWEGFSKLKVDKSHSRRALTNEEIDKLVEIAKTTTKFRCNDCIALLFQVGIYTGLRKSDCCSLKWSEVDFDANMIRKLPKKTKRTGKLARVPIHPKLKEILLSLKREGEYVNPHAYRMYGTDELDGYIKTVFDEAGITTSAKDENGKLKFITGFHALRTSFVSNCARDGIPLNVIQTMVAHSRIDMTMDYTRTNEDDLRLPDFDEVKVSLKKSTYELLKSKVGENQTIDDFIMSLLKDEHHGNQ